MTEPGYGFVPLPSSVRRTKRDEARWDCRVRGTLAGTIELTLTAEQPIHVGSGGRHAEQRDVVLRAARSLDRPVIPGSSLKGVLRARYEAITHSCASVAPKSRTYKIRSRSTDIRKARLQPSALRAPVLGTGPDCTRDRACPACALFGCMSLRSRITITDLVCADSVEFAIVRIPERFSPNLHHVGMARPDATGTVFEVHTLHGRKFGLQTGQASEGHQRVEVIPAGTALRGQIRLFNVTTGELGGLLGALGCIPAGVIKVGGGKAHGLGRAHCVARCRLAGTDARPPDPAQCRQQFIESPDRWAAGEEHLFALHRRDC